MMSIELDPTVDPVRARARFYAPAVAFDRPVPGVPATAFVAERDRAFDPTAPAGFVPLDQAAALGAPWPATTPAMLARYVVLRAGDGFEHRLASTGEVYYVISGSGRTYSSGAEVRWSVGDVFCLGGGMTTRHEASQPAVLMLITDEPALSYLRSLPAVPGNDAVRPTLFAADETESYVREVHGRSGRQRSAGKSVIFLTEPMAERRVTTPTLLASINTLEPGGDQREHQHSSAALTLSIAGEGVYSTVNGKRIDWAPGVVMVTPPGARHSHHNRGAQMMRSFVVQDTALHTELRTTSFRWTDRPAESV
jgi:gentisate 1,2-dioxygenase